MGDTSLAVDKKIRLNLGSGIFLRSGYINVDIYDINDIMSREGAFVEAKIEEGAEYVQADIKHMPFDNEYADYVEMNDVIEHFSFRHVIDALTEVKRVMKTGAKLFLATINMDALALDWVQQSMLVTFDMVRYSEVTQGIYGNQLAPAEFHRCPFNPKFLDAVLTTVGFRDGSMYTLPKGTKSPIIHGIQTPDGFVLRHEHIFAECFK